MQRSAVGVVGKTPLNQFVKYDQINLRFSGNLEGATCSIVDATGKTVGTKTCSADSDTCSFDVSGLPSGIYVMVVNPSVGVTTSKVFQIIR